MDENHIIGFKVVNKDVLIDNNAHAKIIQFRKECERHETTRKWEGAGRFLLLGLSLYDGFRFLDDLFGE
jgi:hypothetical protein